MTKLTSAGAELLRAADTDGAVFDPPHGTAPATIASLIKRGLLISIPVEDAPSRLQITRAGREALPCDPSPTRGSPTVQSPIVPPAADEETPPLEAAAPSKKSGGKLGLLIALLSTPKGATVEQMTEATGWQAHSVRGAMSGALKKGRGLEIVSDKTAGGRFYRIAGELAR